MRNTTLACALLFLGAYSAEAFGLHLYNRSGGTLCAAATQDEPDPYDQDVARITEGWKCVDDFGTLVIERSNGILDVAVRRADGSDYVADSALKLERVTTYVPKDDTIQVFGLEILKFTHGGVVFSSYVGPGAPWGSYQSARTVDALPAKLDAFGFKPLEAWRFGAKHADLGFILY